MEFFSTERKCVSIRPRFPGKGNGVAHGNGTRQCWTETQGRGGNVSALAVANQLSRPVVLCHRWLQGIVQDFIRSITNNISNYYILVG